MILSKRWQSFGIVSVLLLSGEYGRAIVLYGNDTGGATDNTVAPANGAPWNYIAKIDENNASGVYLGYGFVITADHVTGPLASVSISGSVYAIDQSYGALQIGGADLKLLRILGDPGLEPLPLIELSDRDTNRASVVMGWGQGKGAVVEDQGWYWGGDGTRMQRWGTNTTLASYVTPGGETRQYLATEFNRNGGDDEAAIALGDSGGALFQQIGGVWKLAGIAAAEEGPGMALYDKSLAFFPLGDQPDRNYFVPIKLYRDTIVAAIPEPSSTGLLLAGTGMLLGWIRCRR